MLESQKRAENLIIFGVSESAKLSHQGAEAKSDWEKCDMIFTKLGCPVPIENITRIGKENPTANVARPIKVQLQNATDRAAVLNNAKSPKD